MKIGKKTTLLTAVLVPITIFLFVLGVRLSQQSAPPATLFLPGSPFALGVNYPWRMYGGDFGAQVWGTHDGVSTPAATQEIDADFDHLAKEGLTVVRWFVFCDGRGGLQYRPDGGIQGLDSYVLTDMQAALTIAHKHGIRIIFVLLDFPFMQNTPYRNVGGHRKIIERPALTLTFQNNALAPLLKAFGHSPDIAAWEIMNEPEWLMTPYPYWQKSKIGVLKMELFMRTTALYIKARAQQPVTIGSASLAGLNYWDFVGLDFMEFHSYPDLEKSNPLNTKVSTLGHNMPVILGEFPTNNSTVPTSQYLDLMYTNGYAGAFAWSFRATDKYSNLTKEEPAIAAWQKTHRRIKP